VIRGSYDPSKPGKAKEGKGSGSKEEQEAQQPAAVAEAAELAEAEGLALRSLDIFAGCGGLSEGMHQAGVAETRWGACCGRWAGPAWLASWLAGRPATCSVVGHHVGQVIVWRGGRPLSCAASWPGLPGASLNPLEPPTLPRPQVGHRVRAPRR
jgi:hypothetical protein